jgi:predicted outer membrane repeat protein
MMLVSIMIAAPVVCFGEETAIPLELPKVSLSVGTNGDTTLSGEGAAFIGRTGEPRLPWQILTVLLPPDADLASVRVTLDNVHTALLDGQYNVPPQPPAASWQNGAPHVDWPDSVSPLDGRDSTIYGRNAFWPPEAVRQVHVGQLRNWRLARIAVPLMRYNPQTNSLQRLESATLVVSSNSRPVRITRDGGNLFADVVGAMAVNFDAQSANYEPLVGSRTQPGYVIITTSTILNASVQFDAFVAHQQARGFEVQVMTEADFGAGDDDVAAENIRGWLQDHYLTDNIEYVLLIGNPDPSSELPMKRLYPLGPAPDSCPSDMYYADLTGNWDLNGDGYFAQAEDPGLDDFGPGGVDLYWEVLVGRIPYYGSISELDAILARIVDYNTQTPTAAWRRNVLLPMKPLDDSTLGYQLGEEIAHELAAPEAWSYHRIYDDTYGLEPPPESWPCVTDTVVDVWGSGAFGLVVWCSHGNEWGSSGVIDVSRVPELNDTYPAFTFEASCSNAAPEVTDNIAYELLKHGAINTIGATRVSKYYPGQTWFDGSPSNAGMGYEYALRVLGGRTAGEALFGLKQAIWNGNLWPNFTVFNIYGDPAARIVDPVAGPVHNLTQDTWYAAIQDALDAAHQADVIVLTPGTYTGRGNSGIELAGKDLVIRSEDPGNPDVIAQTVLQLDGSADVPRRAFWIHGGQTTLAGLTIAGGYAYDGAGMLCDNGASVTLGDCVFRDNAVPHDGGAVTVYGGSVVTAQRCLFDNNHSDWSGGGLLLNASDAALSDCVFVNNSAQRGGAIAAWGGCTVTLDNCMLTDGQASEGAGLYLRTSTAELVACDLAGNNATWGGCIQANTASEVTAIDSCFRDSEVVYDGGALAMYGSSASVESCDFVNCHAYWGGGILTRDGGLLATGCRFEQNYADYGGGALHSHDGGWAQLQRCTFVDNTAPRGAALHIGGTVAPALQRCRFFGNIASIEGGAANFYGSSVAQFADCVIGGNSAGYGGAFSIEESSEVSIERCTAYANHAAQFGDLLSVAQQATTVLDGAISWPDVGSGAPLRIRDQALLRVAFCDVLGGETAVVQDAGATVYWDDSNIDGDPFYANLPGVDGLPGTEDDDWHLTVWSPCINAGNPDVMGSVDVDGQLRVLCGRVDIGADEAALGDADCDGDVDEDDFALLCGCLAGPDVDFGGDCGGLDFSGDGDVDLTDAAELQRRFGQ